MREAGQRPEIVKLHAAGNHFMLDRACCRGDMDDDVAVDGS